MVGQFYFDTSIWLDFYEKRGSNGEVALRLIENIILGNKIILYSDIVVRELRKLGYSQDEIYAIFRVAKPKNIRKVHVFKEQIDEAEKIAYQKNIPKGDALHAIFARDNNAQLISRDTDFDEIRNIAIAKLPEEFT
ncbi:hypothetical protein CMI42_01770 [Candidatus Pacearchaeota archaeon]|nr:hypothetical protein [Candidatus Pacearchaeota archaeon]